MWKVSKNKYGVLESVGIIWEEVLKFGGLEFLRKTWEVEC